MKSIRTPAGQGKKSKPPTRKTNPPAAEETPEFLHAPGHYHLKAGLAFVARDYPLELLATIAARLLKGPSLEECKTAAETALLLLTECERLHDHHTMARDEVREMVLSTWKYSRDSAHPDTPVIPYKKGNEILTGQKRRDRAEADVRNYLRATRPDWSDETLDAFIDRYRREGFYQLPVEADRRRFAELSASGALGKRKPPLKKGIDGNSALPRATKEKKPASKKYKPAK